MKRQGLSREERIKSKKVFENLFSSGKQIISGDKKIRAIYEISDDLPSGVQIAIAVSKKTGNAVFRNRIKRVIRAAYRINKIDLVNDCLEKRKNIKIIFSPTISKEKEFNIKLNSVENGIINIVNRIKGKI